MRGINSIAVLVVAVMLTGCTPSPQIDDEAQSGPPSSPTTSSPEPTEPVAAAFVMPTTCDQIFTSDFIASQSAVGFVLNSTWPDKPEILEGVYTDVALTLVAGIPRVGCVWTHPDSFHVYDSAAVRQVTTVQRAAMEADLAARGVAPVVVGDTTTYIGSEAENGEVYLTSGNVFRDDVWIAVFRVGGIEVDPLLASVTTAVLG